MRSYNIRSYKKRHNLRYFKKRCYNYALQYPILKKAL